jgi:hypothetical protein
MFPMKRPQPISLIFGTLVLVTLASLFMQLNWFQCHVHAMDAAGCGMTRAFNVIFVQLVAWVTGLLALLFLVPRRAVRVTALALLIPVAVLSATFAANEVRANLRVVGTVTGRDPSR